MEKGATPSSYTEYGIEMNHKLGEIPMNQVQGGNILYGKNGLFVVIVSQME